MVNLGQIFASVKCYTAPGPWAFTGGVASLASCVGPLKVVGQIFHERSDVMILSISRGNQRETHASRSHSDDRIKMVALKYNEYMPLSRPKHSNDII